MLKNVEGKYFKDLGEVVCERCGLVDRPKYIYVEGNNSIQARCSDCNGFIQNVKQVEVMTKEEAEPPTDRQINFIKQFYKSGRLPKSKKRASELIYLFCKVSDD